ncbi:MAG TPA: endonuclease III, partial [Candidatus Wallbacteria bacterium]|nr:endonuclease III [Candidatus Wallbacteria bacterium]
KSLGCGDIEEIMEIIKPTGFYKNKAANIQKCARELTDRHQGCVPDTMEELTALSGVGRKTANVVLQIAFDKNIGIVIDTHVKRLSNRIGFSSNEDPEKIETDLMATIAESEWKNFSFYLIMHGRAVCDAKKPDCASCRLTAHCDYFKSGNAADGKKSKPARDKKGQ